MRQRERKRIEEEVTGAERDRGNERRQREWKKAKGMEEGRGSGKSQREL
ncbi:MAG: hypothetical protein K2G28_02985 [Acetatifactor sp.]|nr:hypothetical protein [Acetatifactor sp.]MDE7352206.1 hypothetical protein [Acetatifactor sp.]